MIKSIIKNYRNNRQTFNPQTDKIKNEKKKKEGREVGSLEKNDAKYVFDKIHISITDPPPHPVSSLHSLMSARTN